ncbi:hypothetical protein GWR56_06535 [Mucilaginibacter sp. 14171R-50]|uniref:hypothetical protein n=1 Tax=Mucilaginibacter sp. 14171R-50 TaxID=2703789 RepID=UPI00138B29DB|nr:hypothetical protein [Mucilaginibacter sp. 14171R-50]QHS55212.1 hypothetical protein GWR56_06535 [Mucilaginibacter sp. 14171R-50]
MKKYPLIYLLFLCLWIASCTDRSQQISGLYINHGESEYSSADDTLYIEPLQLNAKTYTVQQRVGFQRIRDGKKLPREFTTKKWMATWDQDKQVLTQDGFGNQIRFIPGGLLLETAKYKKVK